MARTVGHVINKFELNQISKGQLAQEILTEVYGSAAPAYDWFVTEFNSGYPDGTREENRRYIATAIVKLSTRELISEALFEKSLESLMLSGLSDYRTGIEAARASSTGVKTNVYKMQNSMDSVILEIIALLNSYKTDPEKLTGYYPSAGLLDYVKNLNTSISSMVRYQDGTLIGSGRVGRYRNLWTYSGEGLDLDVKETTLGEIYKAQMLVDTLLAEGYSNVDQRYVLNYLKEMESMTSVISTGVGFMGSAPMLVGSMIGAAGKMLDSSVYSSAMDTLDNANLYNLAKAIADLSITTNLMISKEADIATDLQSVFDTMEGWRKVDPPLPIDIVTADIQELKAEKDTVYARTTAAITVMNKHTGRVTVSPVVEIYDSYGLVNSVDMDTKTVEPGEIGEFVSEIYVPVNMLRDMGGYTAVFTFAASEAETMTISPTFGPYITHFNAGTEEIVDYLRDNTTATQPLGGTLKAGQSESVTVTVPEGSLLYVFAAALSGNDGLCVSVDGNNTPEYSSLINENDHALIRNASGTYTVTVSNNGAKDFEYDLLTLISKDFGAVLGLDMPYANVIAGEYRYLENGETVRGIKASVPVSVYETGLTTDMNINIGVSELNDGLGNTIPAPRITTLDGNDTASGFRLEKGTGKRMMLVYYPEEGTPDGDYSGEVLITVEADRFENELSPLGWELQDGVYRLLIPVSVRIDSTVPLTSSLNAYVNESGLVEVSGIAAPASTVLIFLAPDEDAEGVVIGTASAGANGEFAETVRTDKTGTYYLYTRTSGKNGTLGTESVRIPVTIDKKDTTPPVITLISPETDIQLNREVSEIRFKVTDNESAITDMPVLSVDGTEVEVVRMADGAFRAVLPSGSMGDGTHTVRISAASAGGTATRAYTVIIGETVEFVIAVTADGKPIKGADVSLGGQTGITDTNGEASFALAPGEYQYRVSMEGYLEASGNVSFSAGSRIKNVELLAGGEVRVIISANGQPVEGAAVTFGERQASSDNAGTARVMLPYGTYSYQISAAGYTSESGSFIFAKDTAGPLYAELKVNKSDNFPAYISVTDAIGAPIGGISVTFDGETAQTDTNGEVLFLKNVGTYEYAVEGEGYKPSGGEMNVDASGKKQVIIMQAAGASYDENSEIISLEPGYTAWSEAEGGTEIGNGDTVRRENADRIIYIENASGRRIPFVIPAIGVIGIKDAEIADGSGNEKIRVTVINRNYPTTGNIVLTGGLYDANDKLIKAVSSEIAGLENGEERDVIIDFEDDIMNYTCKIFLWDKKTMRPYCPAWEVNRAEIKSIGIEEAEIVGGSGNKKVMVTVASINYPAENMALTGALYDANDKMIKTVSYDIPKLSANEQKSVTVDFDEDITSYTCKIFLWDKKTMRPYCPAWEVNRAEIKSIGIEEAEIVGGSGNKKVMVTVASINYPAENMALTGALYDANDKMIKTVSYDILKLSANEQKSVTVDFDEDITSYTCKIFLWDKKIMRPYCPARFLGKSE